MIVWPWSMPAFHWLMWWRLGVAQVGFKDGTLGERLDHSGSAFIYGLIHWWVQNLITLSESDRNVGTWSLVIGSRSRGQAFEEHFSLFNVSLLSPLFLSLPAFPSLSLLCHTDHPPFSGSLHQSYVCLFLMWFLPVHIVPHLQWFILMNISHWFNSNMLLPGQHQMISFALPWFSSLRPRNHRANWPGTETLDHESTNFFLPFKLFLSGVFHGSKSPNWYSIFIYSFSYYLLTLFGLLF